MPAEQDPHFTPPDYATQCRNARPERSMEEADAPTGHFDKDRKFPAHDQDRLYLPYKLAWRMRRRSGYVANIRLEEGGRNSNLPASAQVVVKVLRVDPETSQERFVFARTTAYMGAYSPRLIAPCRFAHIVMGDLAPGIVERPNSPQVPKNFAAWDLPEIPTIGRIHGAHMPAWWQVVLEPRRWPIFFSWDDIAFGHVGIIPRCRRCGLSFLNLIFSIFGKPARERMTRRSHGATATSAQNADSERFASVY